MPNNITPVPRPWKLKGDIYRFIFWVSGPQVAHPPTSTYSPPEANSSFIRPQGSRPLGGISMIQIIRYTENPVGPYDELILCPGFHEYNWNIPKHLAAFERKENADGSTNVKVFSHDASCDVKEAFESATPLFQSTFKSVPYVTSFPLSLDVFKYVSLDPTLVQPPPPEGNGGQGELPGTD
ncbi:hypothetical protein LY78DRAFT_708321 [Colletotrichum sublineola]|nr:hypothetical protein LY78DRAFT_708321 [Colletotrichum sublineola]